MSADTTTPVRKKTDIRMVFGEPLAPVAALLAAHGAVRA